MTKLSKQLTASPETWITAQGQSRMTHVGGRRVQRVVFQPQLLQSVHELVLMGHDSELVTGEIKNSKLQAIELCKKRNKINLRTF